MTTAYTATAFPLIVPFHYIKTFNCWLVDKLDSTSLTLENNFRSFWHMCLKGYFHRNGCSLFLRWSRMDWILSHQVQMWSRTIEILVTGFRNKFQILRRNESLWIEVDLERKKFQITRKLKIFLLKSTNFCHHFRPSPHIFPIYTLYFLYLYFYL